MMWPVRAPDAAPLTAGDLLTLDELRDLRRTSSLRGAVLIGHAWLVIAGAIALYVAWPSWLTLALAIPVIGGRQLGLAVLTHEAAHWLLSRAHRANTRVGAWLCAHPLGVDLHVYRRQHHLLVFVPCWRLRDAHGLVLARGYAAGMALAPSYAALLRRAPVS
jgi:fatty acid desaturase